MPRPPKTRFIQGGPQVVSFKPSGVPARTLQTVVLGLDELEAIRLADLEGLYHEVAAARMRISRPTFGRLLAQARAKVADALFHGKALVFQGGAVHLGDAAGFQCGRCGRRWEVPGRSAPPRACAACGSDQISSTVPPGATTGPGRGGHGHGRGRHGRGCDR